MLRKLFYALTTSLVLCGSAFAQEEVSILILDTSLANGSTRVVESASRSSSITIAANSGNPSEPVIGLGGLSRISKTGSAITRFITSASWGATPGVIQPTVIGMNITDASIDVADHAYGDATELAIAAEVCDAIDIDGDAPTVVGCKIDNWRGDGITVRNNTTEVSNMVRIPRVAGNEIRHCWTGIRGFAVDCQIVGNRIANCRDYGIYCTSGSEDLSGNHVFGAQIGIFLDGGPVTSTGDRFSDCPTGMRINSNSALTQVVNGRSEHCWQYSLRSLAERCTFDTCQLRVPMTSTEHPGAANTGETRIVGLMLDSAATQNHISDCRIEISAYTFSGDTNLVGSVGVLVGANNTTIDNLRIRGDSAGTNIAGETGVRVLPSLMGGHFVIDASSGGFNEAGDEVVKFDDADLITGQIWYITYAAGDTPVTIPSGWTSALTIYTRTSAAGTWTQLTTGQAYP
jgi:hypothetical protein